MIMFRPRIHGVDSPLILQRQFTRKPLKSSMSQTRKVNTNRPMPPRRNLTSTIRLLNPRVKKSISPDKFSPYQAVNPYDTYEYCAAYCDYDDDKEQCIQDLIADGMGTCSKTAPCFIESTDPFNSLLNCFVRLLKLIYFIRSRHGNVYDAQMIRVISKIKPSRYGVPMNSLKCVRFPGDGTQQPGFPTTLYHYLQVMTHIDRAYQKGIRPDVYEPIVNKQLDTFASDFQPWTSMLATFVDRHVGGIPDITNIAGYGKFIGGKDLYLYKNITDDPDTLQQNIIKYIRY